MTGEPTPITAIRPGCGSSPEGRPGLVAPIPASLHVGQESTDVGPIGSQ